MARVSIIQRAIALSILLVLSPAVIYGLCYSKIVCKGPVIVKSVKIGYRKKQFIKYNLNVINKDNSLNMHLIDYRIDDIIRLINVVVGNMNIVGPQACPVKVYQKSLALSDRQLKLSFDKRFNVYPGVFQNADHLLTDIGDWVNKIDPSLRYCSAMGELM
jgi:lipopolysaccharide/colanic/teichoic acid biosynthesis glycosyltransferase